MSKKKPGNIYQLKVTLQGGTPPIWRRILVPGDVKLSQLHVVLQLVMGWYNCHFHQFISEGVLYGVSENMFGDDLDLGLEDESKCKLSQLLTQEKDFLLYEYDFGDSWMHKIVLEKIRPYEESLKVPSCIKGKRACPPEDCGGIWGYQGLLDIISDPTHAEYEEMREWTGEEFDPEAFSSEKINVRLAEL